MVFRVLSVKLIMRYLSIVYHSLNAIKLVSLHFSQIHRVYTSMNDR